MINKIIISFTIATSLSALAQSESKLDALNSTYQLGTKNSQINFKTIKSSQDIIEESTTETTKPVQAVDEIFGFLKSSAQAGKGISSSCSLEKSSMLPRQTMLIVVRREKCTNRYTSSLSEDFYVVLYGEHELFIPSKDLFLTKESTEKLDALSSKQVAASLDDWKYSALLVKRQGLKDALRYFDSLKKYGIAIISSEIYDESEHTKGTGFSIKYLNAGNKTIKYITVSVTGLNAVKDPVRNIGGNYAIQFRGIGPIEPDETAKYTKEYMWMTDIVEYFKINHIKIEYMNGSSKIINNSKDIANIEMPPRYSELLETEF